MSPDCAACVVLCTDRATVCVDVREDGAAVHQTHQVMQEERQAGVEALDQGRILQHTS